MCLTTRSAVRAQHMCSFNKETLSSLKSFETKQIKWLPSTSSGSVSLVKIFLNAHMYGVSICLSNACSQKECFRINVWLCVLYIGCEVQPCGRALPAAWAGAGLAPLRVQPGCHPMGRGSVWARGGAATRGLDVGQWCCRAVGSLPHGMNAGLAPRPI